MNLQLVYRHILSLSKNDNMFYEKKNKTKQNKRPPLPLPPPKKKKEKKVSTGESRTRDHRRMKWTRYLWNSAGRYCLKPVERYLWRIERYIRGKQAWFSQLKLYFNSFRRLWRTYGRQVSRKTVTKSLAACYSRRLHEENHSWFSNSKHFRFYWTKKHFISEWYFAKNNEIGSLVVGKV